MITVIGEALVDLVLDPGALTPRPAPGGSPANVALTLARLGHDVTLVTQLGEDEYGELIREHLTASGVRLETGVPGVRTSSALARLDAAGVATYEFDINWERRVCELAPGSRCLHVGSLGTLLQPGAEDVMELVGRVSATGDTFVSYDPNARPSLTPDPPATAKAVSELAGAAHLVKMSEEDLHFLFPGRTEEQIATELLEGSQTQLVVVTRGAQGVFAATRAVSASVDPVRVEVVDTVGAGDAFMAGLLDALSLQDLLDARRSHELSGIDATTLTQILSRASVVAAITCSRPGADPPTAEEVAAFLGS